MPEVMVTDHAVVRYFERVLGVDVCAIRNAIADGVASGVALNAKRVRLGRAQFTLVGSDVVTCVSVGHRKTRHGRRQRED